MSTTTHLSQFIKEAFGSNSDYVEGLLQRYEQDPNLVDDSWKQYFGDLLNGRPTSSEVTTNGTGNADASETAIESRPVPSVPVTTEAPAKTKIAATVPPDTSAKPITGPAKKIVENMEQSLTVPTATSFRNVPVKVLEENRRILNDHRSAEGHSKISFTHIIAWAIVEAVKGYPRLNHGYADVDGKPSRLEYEDVNLGIAIDLEKKDGSRSLLVPNIKAANKMNFEGFLDGYNDCIKRAREGKLEIVDFQGTTLSLTNPGTIGTAASNPRLMSGQSAIIATGAIEFPAEYQGMSPAATAALGISKTITLTSTYDHRVIQGAESGLFLARISELLMGQHGFYDRIFEDLDLHYPPLRWAQDKESGLFGERSDGAVEKQGNVLALINAYRVRGHLLADIDPLNMLTHYQAELDLENFGLTIWDLDREFITGGLHGEKTATLRRILDILRRAYCGKVGIEYRHIAVTEEKDWIRAQVREHFVDTKPLSPEIKKELLTKLIEGEQFEHFVHKKYLGQKRFSLEGCETVIPMLDQLLEGASARGVNEIYLGMAHRGRLNVLTNIIGDPGTADMAERIFTVFEGTSHPRFPADEGDVKYHQGAEGLRKTKVGKEIAIKLSSNPSHLETVNPVVEGMARARQDQLRNGDSMTREQATSLVLPVLIHGDAAFAGQGVVMETLQLEQLQGYRTGGTIHLVINNQVGFTTSPEHARSSLYATDAGHITRTPIFHVNGDDPESAYRVIQIALDYRAKFSKDVVLDLVGFRRLGHNEGDEPSYTQPVMYARVKAHPGTQALYAQQLIREGVITENDHSTMLKTVDDRFERVLAAAKDIATSKKARTEIPEAPGEDDGSTVVETGVSKDVLKIVVDKITLVPDAFHINSKMVGQLARRAKMGDGEVPMDWGFGEAMSFGSMVVEGTPVRLSGQDSGRGTFSQRHASMYDTMTGERWTPLAEIKNDANPAARFYVFDSSLSEYGVLGFEYGYTVISQNQLVAWEAQFGDFSNGAQIITDQYISSSEDKWQQRSRLVLLLPHGYEGQGPEHSSARLERYLQLCAENNMQVCYPTTPAQYFHLLRRQVKQEIIRPLIVMTPKSLLRLPAASSNIDELTHGGFVPVINDGRIEDRDAVRRIVVCSGKVYYDLEAAREGHKSDEVAVVRLEQFYPFPRTLLTEIIASYPNATEFIWTQEEPQNMGGWTFVEDRINQVLPAGKRIRYVGRTASASPATGSYTIHNLEQAKLVSDSLTLNTDETSKKVAPAGS
jgi:2-oxoglutarate dehydrogenase E1 component